MSIRRAAVPEPPSNAPSSSSTELNSASGRSTLAAFSSSVSAARYTRDPCATSLAAASSHSGEKPNAAIELTSTTLPAPLRSASSLGAGASGSALDVPSTAPTSSIEMRSRFFALASYSLD